MLEVLHSLSDLKEVQRLFQSKFEPYIDENIDVVIGFHGDSLEATVHWSDELGIWMCFSEAGDEKVRYWNAFGIEKPKPGANLSITCEINIPQEGIDRRIGGAFVQDSSTGHLFLMHRGTIGGSKKGVGKGLFESLYAGEWTDVKDGYKGNKDVVSRLALIAAFNSPRFGRQVAQFVHNVRNIKDFVSGTSFNENWEPDTDVLHGEFIPEFSGGKQPYTVEQVVQAECDHGIIVNGLAEQLRNRCLNVGNDRHRDLYVISSDNSIRTVFEIKTDVTTSSIYKAVGQLLLNNVEVADSPQLFMVIPASTDEMNGKLSKLGIQVITYAWEKNNLVFDGLKDLNATAK